MDKRSIIITGEKGYIAQQLYQHCQKHHPEWKIKTISVRKQLPSNLQDFDTIIHTAGLVHRREKKHMKTDYYAINTTLSEKLAQEAKQKGVKQFIFISTMAVYGVQEKNIKFGKRYVITSKTIPEPKSFYGSSKLAAEKALLNLEDNNKFSVAILRPPMVYGEGCPGNYRKLQKLACIIPVFPYIENERSMISIEKLCTSIEHIICQRSGGIFHPQDDTYVCTSLLLKSLGRQYGKHIYLSPFLGHVVKFFPFSFLKKMFGNLVYDKQIDHH